MVATITDLSRRGDTGGLVVPQVFAAADALLRTWMAAANAQNPLQQLSIVKAPGEVPGFTGWVIKGRLAVLDAGQPVELMSQWVANLTTGAITTHCGLASGYTPGAALGGYGALTGGVGTTNSLMEPLPEPLRSAPWWPAPWSRGRNTSASRIRSTPSATARRWWC